VSRIGGSPLLYVYDEEPPGLLMDYPERGPLATFQLPEVWWETAAAGVITMVGTWRTRANGAGKPRFYRIYSSDGVARAQGSAGGPGSLREIELDADEMQRGQSIEVTEFIIVDGNG
jgi:hypothetical protein